MGRPPILSYGSYCLDNWHKIIEDEEGKKSYDQGYWVKMVRSGQASTFKPAKLPDGSAEMFTDLRDWYLTSTGQKK